MNISWTVQCVRNMDGKQGRHNGPTAERHTMQTKVVKTSDEAARLANDAAKASGCKWGQF